MPGVNFRLKRLTEKRLKKNLRSVKVTVNMLFQPYRGSPIEALFLAGGLLKIFLRLLHSSQLLLILTIRLDPIQSRGGQICPHRL